MVIRLPALLLIGAVTAKHKESSLVDIDDEITLLDTQLKNINEIITTSLSDLDVPDGPESPHTAPKEVGNMDQMVARANKIRAVDEKKKEAEDEKLQLVKQKIALI